MTRKYYINNSTKLQMIIRRRWISSELSVFVLDVRFNLQKVTDILKTQPSEKNSEI